jgi:hypothetical protein
MSPPTHVNDSWTLRSNGEQGSHYTIHKRHRSPGPNSSLPAPHCRGRLYRSATQTYNENGHCSEVDPRGLLLLKAFYDSVIMSFCHRIMLLLVMFLPVPHAPHVGSTSTALETVIEMSIKSSYNSNGRIHVTRKIQPKWRTMSF